MSAKGLALARKKRNVLLLPHVVTRYLPSQVVSEATRVAGGVAYGEGAAVNCHLYPETQSATFERFGVEVDKPYGLICDVKNIEDFPQGTLVELDTRTFIVRVPPYRMEFEALSVTNHGLALLQEVSIVGGITNAKP